MSFSTLKNCSWYEEGKKLLDCNKLHLGTAEGSITYLRAGNIGKSFSCTSLQRIKNLPKSTFQRWLLYVPCPSLFLVAPATLILHVGKWVPFLETLELCFLRQNWSVWPFVFCLSPHWTHLYRGKKEIVKEVNCVVWAFSSTFLSGPFKLSVSGKNLKWFTCAKPIQDATPAQSDLFLSIISWSQLLYCLQL